MGFDHFDILAPIYDRLIPQHNLQDWDGIFQFSSSDVLLDVGAGTGRISRELCKKVNYVVLADVSRNMLRQVTRNAELFLVNTEIETNCFQSQVFDRIIMVDAFHHVRNHRVTVNELWRILKPGGTIYIIEPDIKRISVKLLALFEKILLMRTNFYSSDRLAKLFSGFNAIVTLHFHRSNYCLEAVRQDGD